MSGSAGRASARVRRHGASRSPRRRRRRRRGSSSPRPPAGLDTPLRARTSQAREGAGPSFQLARRAESRRTRDIRAEVGMRIDQARQHCPSDNVDRALRRVAASLRYLDDPSACELDRRGLDHRSGGRIDGSRIPDSQSVHGPPSGFVDRRRAVSLGRAARRTAGQAVSPLPGPPRAPGDEEPVASPVPARDPADPGRAGERALPPALPVGERRVAGAVGAGVENAARAQHLALPRRPEPPTVPVDPCSAGPHALSLKPFRIGRRANRAQDLAGQAVARVVTAGRLVQAADVLEGDRNPGRIAVEAVTAQPRYNAQTPHTTPTQARTHPRLPPPAPALPSRISACAARRRGPNDTGACSMDTRRWCSHNPPMTTNYERAFAERPEV